MSQRLTHIKNNLVSSQASRLKQARQSTNLNGQELKDIIFGQGNFNKHIKPTLDFIDRNRHIFTQHNIQEHSMSEQREESARMIMALRKFWDVDLENRPLDFCMVSYAISMFNGAISTKSLLQYLLYAKSLLLYGSSPFHKQLYIRAIKGQDLGCFSLTEFHHGSYSKGIQTLAVYDPKTDQFVLTSQGTKGMKFWIGALSQVSNTTILWAQLVIDGKSQGPHPFYLPIRCPKTHRVLEGITIGDCGPKKGLNYIDNGYMMLDNVRIPRSYLLGKYGSVDQKGTYSSMIQSWDLRFGLHMSALSSGRAYLAFTVNIFTALTIALRYAHSRKQFQTTDKKDQIIIIDYPLTQMRLIPEISKMVLHLMGGVQLSTIYCQKTLFEDSQKLTQMHAISAAVKARYTWSALKGYEESRTILGGHGYSSLSRIPSSTDDIGVNVTWQGDNNVLLQQTSKYLMKTIGKKLKAKVIDLSFVHQKVDIDLEEMEDNLRDIKTVEILLQDLLRVRYFSAQSNIKQLSQKYKEKQTIDMHFHPQSGNALSLAFADYWTFSVAKNRILKAKSNEMKQYLSDCLYLWSFDLLEKQRYGSHQFRAALQKQIVSLISQLVNRSVIATDFLTISSQLIGSPFAEPNGQGFKEYINILFTRKDAFTRAKHYKTIQKKTEIGR